MMKKLFGFVLLACAMVLGGCSNNDNDLLRSLPDDVEVLARIDLKETAMQMGYSWMDILMSVVNNKQQGKEDMGIDLKRNCYAFVTERQQEMGFLVPVSDAEKLKKYVATNFGPVTERDGIYTVKGEGVAFTKDRLIVVEAARGRSVNLEALLKKTELDNEDIIKQLSSIDDPLAVAVDMEILKSNSAGLGGGNVALAASMLGADFDDIYFLAGVCFTPGSLVLSTSFVPENVEAEGLLNGLKDKCVEIKDAKIPFVPNTYSCLMACNLKGKELQDILPMGMLPDGTSHLLGALDGLLTISLGKVVNDKSLPPFVLTSQANDITCLDPLMEGLQGFGMPIVDQGRHTYVYDLGFGGDSKMLIGAQGGFVFMNYGNNMQRPEGNNTVKLEPGTVGYVRVNFDNILPAAGKGLHQFTFWTQADLTMHATLTLTNTWKDLIEQLQTEQ